MKRMKRGILLAGVIFASIFILFSGLVYVTSLPSFCGSCHIMKPYVASWRTSSHSRVPCTDCHYTPGVRNEISAKFQGLSMMVQYFTGTAGPLPWAQVENASCLRSGCHETRVLEGKVRFDGVIFDHKPHLTQMRRGKALRCTSCHSQIVQGTHVSVTPTTCYLCHFKEVELGEKTANCYLCHSPESEGMQVETPYFNHKDAVEKHLDCLHCHAKVVVGDGRVPKERCLSCHNEPERLERLDDHIYLHMKHVTETKIECLNCHMEIQHSRQAALEVLPAECSNCHQDKHALVKQFYMGLGAIGVESKPDPMFLAQIDCKACHTIQVGETYKASPDSCVKCHGEDIRPVFQGWEMLVEKNLSAAMEEFETVRDILSASPKKNVQRILEQVQHNLSLIRNAKGTHNVGYTKAILAASQEWMNQALREAGQPERPPIWAEVPYTINCLTCHIGAENVTIKTFDSQEYPHARHVIQAKLKCTECHGDPHKPGKKKIITRVQCNSCHHQKTKLSCADCHGKGPEKVIPFLEKQFSHSQHLDAGIECATCHEPGKKLPAVEVKEICETCHPAGEKE